MQCEVCEKLIAEGKRVKIEGSVVVTCNECAKYGEIVGAASSREKKESAPQIKKEPSVAFEIGSEELIEDYADLIRKKRERRGLKQEDLARLINEPASLIHRVEIGKMEPSLDVARKLQNVLNVKLLQKTESTGTQSVKSEGSGELTLGDMVFIKKKEKK